jgi:ATP-binding cassette subfamily F protein uup
VQPRKLTYNDQRDFDRLPQEIDRLQSEIDRTEQELHDSGLYGRDPRRFIELTDRAARLRAEKEAAELRWLEVAERAESLAR